MSLRLEAIVIPVSDVDRAKQFYKDTLGFREDIDFSAASYEKAVGFRYRDQKSYRIVQLTPPGSACSIQFGEGVTKATPGSYEGLYLITSDIEAARNDLLKRGVQVSELFYFGPQGETPGIDPTRAIYSTHASFRDPDGNQWFLQDIKTRPAGTDLRLEAITIPISDNVDRAKQFYEQALGFQVDSDSHATTYETAQGYRYRDQKNYHRLQLTPPGSGCSILIGPAITKAKPGSYEGLYLVTSDLESTRNDLLKRGVPVSEPFYYGPQGEITGLEPTRADYNNYASFKDPDGNSWLIQEIKKRLPGR